MTETRQERFKRLATYRTNAVLEKLRILGNLSNKTNYDYSEEDIRKIFNVIEGQFKVTKHRFTGQKRFKFQL